MREIVFDTETTGLSPAKGDRMVEIGCVELINRVETGKGREGQSAARDMRAAFGERSQFFDILFIRMAPCLDLLPVVVLVPVHPW